jgi:hypothetical protein
MCPLSPLHQNLSDFLGEEKVLYLTPLPPPPTPSRRPPWSLVRGGLMDWYLDKFRYRTCIWCNDKWMVQAWAGTYFWGTPEIHLVHFKRGRDGRFFCCFSYSQFFNRQWESRAILLTRQDCFRDSGTKAAPLLVSRNRGHAILSVSYRNVSAALSLLNKVCNSI